MCSDTWPDVTSDVWFALCLDMSLMCDLLCVDMSLMCGLLCVEM